jgi:hypothetical protein
MKPPHELLDTIEQIRKNKFPQLSAELVNRIVSIEIDYTDNRQEAYKRIIQAIDHHLSNAKE